MNEPITLSCPAHDDDAKCVEILNEDGIFQVKLHGSYWIGPKGTPLQYPSADDAKDAVGVLFSQLDFKPTVPAPKPELFAANNPVEFPKMDPYTYNYYQVMVQGTPHGPYVLVNSPRFGPLAPDQALNLAAWLRRFAEECGNLTKSFDEIWKGVKNAK